MRVAIMDPTLLLRKESTTAPYAFHVGLLCPFTACTKPEKLVVLSSLLDGVIRLCHVQAGLMLEVAAVERSYKFTVCSDSGQGCGVGGVA